MFDKKNIQHYVFAFGLILLASYFGKSFMKAMDDKGDDYEMIRKYLLNESPLYGYNRPKLWIHSKYELNARKWKSFQSRGSNDLNQPYLHLTIKTIINHCGQDFNVCLIDDESFSHLIPNWDIKIPEAAEPMKTHYRELALVQLLRIYGGMVVPNSFVCSRNLIELYHLGVETKCPFVCENINHSMSTGKQNARMLFAPDAFFMGCEKNDPVIGDLVEYLKRRNLNPHFSSEVEFFGQTSQWFVERAKEGRVKIVGGDMIGLKTRKNKPVMLEDLLGEESLDITPSAYGIYIPSEEILSRTKYQWFAALPEEDILNTTAVVVKYIKASIVDTSGEYPRQPDSKSNSSIIRSVISI